MEHDSREKRIITGKNVGNQRVSLSFCMIMEATNKNVFNLSLLALFLADR